jgi:L-alanine-DL-glutamate epimerase-like enolase superfamily enzyme
MKITDVKTTVIKGNFEWTLVLVYTDEGITGLGEAYWGAGVKETILHMKDMLVGQDPTDVERIYQDMYRAFLACGSTGGIAVTAISGIEIALWDIAGKVLNAPVYKLLGGKFRDKIRVYADCGSDPARRPEAYARKALGVRDRGYTAMKFDIDGAFPELPQRDRYNRCLSAAEVERMAGLVKAVREAVGNEVDLAIDLHWSYNTVDAIKIAHRLEECNLMWLEDPIPPENVDALAKVTAATKTPICTGENLYTKHGFREVIRKQAADILEPDIPKVGGLAETKKIADMAESYYIPVAPHNVSSPVGTIAAAHVCASIPNFLALEFHSADVPWWNDLIKTGKPIIDEGYIQVPDKPGLGVELNEEVIIKHLKKGETFSL